VNVVIITGTERRDRAPCARSPRHPDRRDWCWFPTRVLAEPEFLRWSV